MELTDDLQELRKLCRNTCSKLQHYSSFFSASTDGSPRSSQDLAGTSILTIQKIQTIQTLVSVHFKKTDIYIYICMVPPPQVPRSHFLPCLRYRPQMTCLL